MITHWVAMAAVFSAGALVILQAPVNARLGSFIGGPIAASIISFAVGLAALTIAGIFMRQLPAFGNVSQTASWMWMGGLFGAWIVVSSVYAVPITGTTLLFALIFSGQMISALIIDHFGLLLPDPHPVNWQRLAGVACLITGVLLIQRF